MRCITILLLTIILILIFTSGCAQQVNQTPEAITEAYIQAIKRSEAHGDLMDWKALELHFLFHVKRTVERFDPPVHIGHLLDHDIRETKVM